MHIQDIDLSVSLSFSLSTFFRREYVGVSMQVSIACSYLLGCTSRTDILEAPSWTFQAPRKAPDYRNPAFNYQNHLLFLDFRRFLHKVLSSE